MSESELHLFESLCCIRNRLEEDISLLDWLVWLWFFKNAGMPV